MKAMVFVLTRLAAPLLGIFLLLALALVATGMARGSELERSPAVAVDEVPVPAGVFSMGCATDNYYPSGVCDADGQPIHTVYVDAFYMDRLEVTNAQYRACVGAGACPPPLSNASATRSDYYTNLLYNDYPVIQVDWQRAHAYCQWVGRRLPTEAEWEKAARGTDLRWFPWGNADPTCERLNYGACGHDTVAVGSHPAGASPYGALDMAGNVSEWVDDLYTSRYYHTSPYDNPQGPASTNENEHLARGGSWALSFRHITTYARLDGSDIYHVNEIGFRCARTSETPNPPTPTPSPTPTPFAASAIRPDGGALWLASPEHLTLLNVPPGAIGAETPFTLTYDGRSNIQGDLQGMDHFFSLEAGTSVSPSIPVSLTTPVRLFAGFTHPGGLISNTIDLYRLEAGGWLTDGITVTERTPNYILAWVEWSGTYGVLGRAYRVFLPLLLR